MFRLVDCLEMAQPLKLYLPGCSELQITMKRQSLASILARWGASPVVSPSLGSTWAVAPRKVRAALTPLQLGVGAGRRRKGNPPWAASAAIVWAKYWNLGVQKPLQGSQAVCLCRLTTTLNFFVNKTEGMRNCQNANTLLHTVIFICEV